VASGPARYLPRTGASRDPYSLVASGSASCRIAIEFLMPYGTDLSRRSAMRWPDRSTRRDAAGVGYIIFSWTCSTGGQDFRYRMFGSTIAGVSGFDMTGRRGRITTARHISSSCHGGVSARRLATRRAAADGATTTRRLTLFDVASASSCRGDEAGAHTRFLIGNVRDARWAAHRAPL